MMTLMSALHNVSRSMGVALLLTNDDQRLVVIFVSFEMTIYMLYKVIRGEFYYFAPIDGFHAVVVGFWTRVLVKIVTDFRYDADAAHQKKNEKKCDRANATDNFFLA